MYQGKICDVHVHLHESFGFDSIERLCGCYDRFLLLGSSNCGESKKPDGGGYLRFRGISNASQLMMKLTDTERVYSIASVDLPDKGVYSAEDMLAQVKLYHEMGFDGIKRIEGKPNCRRRTGVPLDDLCYEPMFAWMEENDFPVLSHVNDPRVFWDREKMLPEWIARGWAATEENPSFDEVRAEALHVLDRHPNLRVVFAHFFYAQESLEDADAILEKYPNVYFDLTPGTHYYDMEAKHDEFRDFLIRRADRILYGSDTEDNSETGFPENCRDILMTDKDLILWGNHVTGYGLPEDALKKIFETNFVKFLGEKPRKVNTEQLPQFLDWSIEHTKDCFVSDKITAELSGMKAGFTAARVK